MHDDLIFDLGMHRGGDTRFYLERGYRVVAVEANPALVQHARREFAQYVDSGRLFIVPFAIAERHGVRKFFVNRLQDDWSSLLGRFGKRGGGFSRIKVPTMPLLSLIEIFGTPLYIKIDIEGLDKFCVDQLALMAELPQYVSSEATVPKFVPIATRLGYSKFKLVGQRRAARHQPQAVVHGPAAELAPAGLTSGHFGEEAYGRWLSADEMTAEVMALRKGRWEETLQMRELGFTREEMAAEWWDFHAALE
jgi:FkbM family methyltransferase